MRKSEAQEPGSAKDAFLDEDPEWVVRENSERNRVYDLEERMPRFGEAIIDFAKTIRENPVTMRIINQLVGAGTIVGANYCKADDVVSKKDFLKSIGTSRKSARNEAFSPMIVRAVLEVKARPRTLWHEAKRTASNLLKDLEK